MAKTDLEIANAASLRPVVDVAADLNLSEDDLDLYGRHKAKVHLDVLDGAPAAGTPRYIIVTAMTPTKQGEGKTVTTVAKCAMDAQQGRATYVDQEVVIDGNLVTARTWHDNTPLLREFVKMLKSAS